MLLGWLGRTLVREAAQRLDDLLAGLRRADDGVHVAELSGLVGVEEVLLELLGQLRAQSVVVLAVPLPAMATALDGLTVELADGAWFNLRASNTEPLLRLNVEAPDEARMTELTNQVLEMVRA